GAIRNPLMALSHILSTMKNVDEEITVEGFYDDVEPMTEKERKLISKVEGEDYKKTTGVKETVSEKDITQKNIQWVNQHLKLMGCTVAIKGKEQRRLYQPQLRQKLLVG